MSDGVIILVLVLETKLVYSGREGEPEHRNTGGGTNPQCLPLDPNYFKNQPGKQTDSLMHGTEYHNTNGIVPNNHDKDVPCTVSHVSTRTTLYMMPAKYTCPSGWTTEYYGYLMTEQNHPNQHGLHFICVDKVLKAVTGTYYHDDGSLLIFVEGRCGSFPCPPHEETKELPCAVCTK